MLLAISTWFTTTFHREPAHSQQTRPETTTAKLHWGALWTRFINQVTQTPEPHVWQHSDRHGHITWHAYDPMTDRSYSSGSEDEMRQWLEERYYFSRQHQPIRDRH
ncbi:MAG: hypothetical protein Kow00121_62530 [Elainellaceae cyanobacterium]